MELGSEFNLSINDLIIHKHNICEYLSDMDSVYFNSGRSALTYTYSMLMRDGKVLLPEYLCESICTCFPIDKIVFYKLTKNMQVDLEDLNDKISNEVSVLFILNYFGIEQQNSLVEFVRDIKNKFDIIVVEDTTHSIFHKKITVGDYAIASIRKWMPVPDGGLLYFKKGTYHPDISQLSSNKAVTKFYAMVLKTLYLKDMLNCNLLYRKIFELGERSFEIGNIELISDISMYLLRCIDINDMTSKRASNFQYLKRELKKLDIPCAFDGINTTSPFVFPILVENRDEFRCYLNENNIYCAVHWPCDTYPEQNRVFFRYISQHILSLPIDQRYGQEEMRYMVDVIKVYRSRLKLCE